MEATAEGLAAAAATRRALKRKADDGSLVEGGSVSGAAPAVAPPATTVHEVLKPDGYTDATTGLDPALHGVGREEEARERAPVLSPPRADPFPSPSFPPPSRHARRPRLDGRHGPGLPLHPGPVSSDRGRLPRAPRVRPRRGAHERRQDGRRGVRGRHGPARRPARHLHVPAQSVVEPKVSRAGGRVWRRRPPHGGRHHLSQRPRARHDDRDPAVHAVPGG